ncbi:hypothetical protein [Streptomyces sp. CBMA123]|uniref:hypothetical protein n=1 Tax=Streptomyces sp. CBMA123 TaxID=1896313 RepID=UPI0016620240|nr:hypothetical protein [Streptomyces sp. CBMA123]MBD0695803.1 hypothetical protein [Streptomyces sp. CBMA123]
MQTYIRDRAPRLRCRDCGGLRNIRNVCHHCGGALCDEHAVRSTDAEGRNLTSEYADLDLDTTPVIHCPADHHVVKGPLKKWLWGGAGGALLGLLLVILDANPFTLLVFLAGAGTAAYGYYGEQHRIRRMLESRPKLPLTPGLDSVEIAERLSGELLLSTEGVYTSAVDPVDGGVQLRLTFGQKDRDRLKCYRAKYQLGPAAEADFSAGYVLLAGEAGLRFKDPALNGCVIPLVGRVSDHPFLDTAATSAGAQWQASFPYALDATSQPDHLPLWLTPSLVPEQDRRTLELELQWVPFRSGGEADLRLESVHLLRLEVPAAWGNVESVSSPTAGNSMRHYTISDVIMPDGRPPYRTIEWVQAATSTEERTKKRLVVSVRFEKQIKTTDAVKGRIEARFGGTLSGLTGVSMAHPLGGGVQQPAGDRRAHAQPGRKTTARTEVAAEFTLNLALVRYQDVRKVPDRRVEDDSAREEKTSFGGVIPDHETVIALTNALAEHYYIKRVLENPPRGSGRANTVNRYWDIAGRLYDGVLPIDFQIILTGVETRLGGIRAERGDAEVGVTVTASYANEAMKETIGSAWDGLNHRVGEALKHALASQPRTVAQPPQREEAVLDTGSVPGPRPPADRPAAGTDADAAEAKKKRRQDLTDALLAGRISEAIYLTLRAEIDEEP